jgi:hypothetical protein
VAPGAPFGAEVPRFGANDWERFVAFTGPASAGHAEQLAVMEI